MSVSYVILTCRADFTSYRDIDFANNRGVKWRALGEVVHPDFGATENPECGLRGLLNGCGDGSFASWLSDFQWLLVAVPTETIIDLGDEVRFPRGEVIFSSQDRLAVIAELERLNPETKHMPVIGAARSSMSKYALVFTGDHGTATSKLGGTSISGDHGTSTSGCYGKSVSGYKGTSISRHNGTSISKEYGTSTSLDDGTSTSGSQGAATSGDRGKSTSGDGGKSTSGEGGTSISGKYGTCISGRKGKSIVDIHGKAKSGLEGNLILSYEDNGNIKTASFFVDGETVKADTFYKCVDGKLVEVLNCTRWCCQSVQSVL